jgi:hypothetical protein
LDKNEKQLEERLRRLEELEKEIKKKEAATKAAEKERKQILLRLSPSLWRDLSAWAEEDFRSINGQIEYLLTKAVNERKK